MNGAPIVLGILLGAGALLGYSGLRTIMNKQLDQTARRRGYWSFNGGLILMAISMYAMVQIRA